jgi:hypothetical protein
VFAVLTIADLDLELAVVLLAVVLVVVMSFLSQSTLVYERKPIA